MRNKKFSYRIVSVMLAVAAHVCLADGVAVDKIYQPYVNPLEKEFEYRVFVFNEGETNLQRHALSYGQALGDKLAAEFYVGLDKSENESIQLAFYELEVRYQLSEQGEYSADWGILGEIEKSKQNDIWETALGIITTRDFGQLTTTLNAFIEYEWGDDVVSELEFAARGQALYRYRPALEPGIELHLGQDTAAAGPMLKGAVRQSPGKKWLWEVSLLCAINSETPDFILKANLEFEFN